MPRGEKLCPQCNKYIPAASKRCPECRSYILMSIAEQRMQTVRMDQAAANDPTSGLDFAAPSLAKQSYFTDIRQDRPGVINPMVASSSPSRQHQSNVSLLAERKFVPSEQNVSRQPHSLKPPALPSTMLQNMNLAGSNAGVFSAPQSLPIFSGLESCSSSSLHGTTAYGTTQVAESLAALPGSALCGQNIQLSQALLERFGINVNSLSLPFSTFNTTTSTAHAPDLSTAVQTVTAGNTLPTTVYSVSGGSLTYPVSINSEPPQLPPPVLDQSALIAPSISVQRAIEALYALQYQQQQLESQRQEESEHRLRIFGDNPHPGTEEQPVITDRVAFPRLITVPSSSLTLLPTLTADMQRNLGLNAAADDEFLICSDAQRSTIHPELPEVITRTAGRLEEAQPTLVEAAHVVVQKQEEDRSSSMVGGGNLASWLETAARAAAAQGADSSNPFSVLFSTLANIRTTSGNDVSMAATASATASEVFSSFPVSSLPLRDYRNIPVQSPTHTGLMPPSSAFAATAPHSATYYTDRSQVSKQPSVSPRHDAACETPAAPPTTIPAAEVLDPVMVQALLRLQERNPLQAAKVMSVLLSQPQEQEPAQKPQPKAEPLRLLAQNDLVPRSSPYLQHAASADAASGSAQPLQQLYDYHHRTQKSLDDTLLLRRRGVSSSAAVEPPKSSLIAAKKSSLSPERHVLRVSPTPASTSVSYHPLPTQSSSVVTATAGGSNNVSKLRFKKCYNCNCMVGNACKICPECYTRLIPDFFLSRNLSRDVPPADDAEARRLSSSMAPPLTIPAYKSVTSAASKADVAPQQPAVSYVAPKPSAAQVLGRGLELRQVPPNVPPGKRLFDLYSEEESQAFSAELEELNSLSTTDATHPDACVTNMTPSTAGSSGNAGAATDKKEKSTAVDANEDNGHHKRMKIYISPVCSTETSVITSPLATNATALETSTGVEPLRSTPRSIAQHTALVDVSPSDEGRTLLRSRPTFPFIQSSPQSAVIWPRTPSAPAGIETPAGLRSSSRASERPDDDSVMRNSSKYDKPSSISHGVETEVQFISQTLPEKIPSPTLHAEQRIGSPVAVQTIGSIRREARNPATAAATAAQPPAKKQACSIEELLGAAAARLSEKSLSPALPVKGRSQRADSNTSNSSGSSIVVKPEPMSPLTESRPTLYDPAAAVRGPIFPSVPSSSTVSSTQMLAYLRRQQLHHSSVQTSPKLAPLFSRSFSSKAPSLQLPDVRLRMLSSSTPSAGAVGLPLLGSSSIYCGGSMVSLAAPVVTASTFMLEKSAIPLVSANELSRFLRPKVPPERRVVPSLPLKFLKPSSSPMYLLQPDFRSELIRSSDAASVESSLAWTSRSMPLESNFELHKFAGSSAGAASSPSDIIIIDPPPATTLASFIQRRRLVADGRLLNQFGSLSTNNLTDSVNNNISALDALAAVAATMRPQ